MINLLLVYSKYILVLFILCYSLFTLSYLRTKSHTARDRVAGSQRFFLFALHFLGYLVLLARTGNLTIIYLYIAEVAFLAIFQILWRLIYPRSSALVTNNICMLLAINFIIQARLDADSFKRQLIMIAAAGIVSLVLPAFMQTFRNITERLKWLIGGLSVLSLAAVTAFGGTEYGAKLSLSAIGIPLQPAEFVKITICFFIAAMLARSSSFKQVAKTTAVTAICVLILVLNKDLGGALIFFISYILIIYISTQKPFYTLAGAGLGALAAAAAYKFFSHVRARVQVWRNPWEDPTGTGYQVLQALFAIGTAGWFGMGLYSGAAETIPLASSDFVFAALAEELGGVFALCLILICFENTVQILWLSSSLRSSFDKILVSGIGIFYGIQVFINVGGVLKMIPSTGVTLPFVSSGGSSVFASFLAFAVIQSCFIRSEEIMIYDQAMAQDLEDKISGFYRENSAAGKLKREDEPAQPVRKNNVSYRRRGWNLGSAPGKRRWSTARGIDYDSFKFETKRGYGYEYEDQYDTSEEVTKFSRRGDVSADDVPDEEVTRFHRRSSGRDGEE